MLSMGADAKDSLPPIVEGRVPQGVDELWAGYDPRAEALDIKVIHEWDETYQDRPLKVRMELQVTWLPVGLSCQTGVNLPEVRSICPQRC